MAAIDRGRIKGWATAMVAAVEPGDVFVVEDGFGMAVDATSLNSGYGRGGAFANRIAGVWCVVDPEARSLQGKLLPTKTP